MDLTRRRFLGGLIAAPFVVRYASLMPMGRPAVIIGGERWWVVDTTTGLQLHLTAAEICGPMAHRYQPVFEWVERPLTTQGKVALEFRKNLEWHNGVLVPKRLAQGERLSTSRCVWDI